MFGRLLSLAPTVMQFLAAASDPSDPRSITPFALPSPSTEPATWVPWPSGSSALFGRPNATSFNIRPVKAGCDIGRRAAVKTCVVNRNNLTITFKGGSIDHDMGIEDRPRDVVEQ